MKKKESSFKGYLFCVFALSLILCSTIAFGATIHVPTDYKTIQAAIDAASAEVTEIFDSEKADFGL